MTSTCSPAARPPTTLHICILLPTLTSTPTIPPLVCVTYVTQQPVLLSLRGIVLLLQDYSRLPSPYVSLRPGVRACVVPCSCYQKCAACCFCWPVVGCVRIGLSLPFEQSLTLVLRSCCLAAAFCSDGLFVPVSSLCRLLFFSKCSFAVPSSPLCVADVDTGARHRKNCSSTTLELKIRSVIQPRPELMSQSEELQLHFVHQAQCK